MREVLEEHYPKASKVVVVLDNLNTYARFILRRVSTRASESLHPTSAKLASASQPARGYRQLAIPHGGCTDQTQATLSRTATGRSACWVCRVTG